jgi:hypothetical protein
MKKGAEIDAVHEQGYTALIAASMDGYLEVVK